MNRGKPTESYHSFWKGRQGQSVGERRSRIPPWSHPRWWLSCRDFLPRWRCRWQPRKLRKERIQAVKYHIDHVNVIATSFTAFVNLLGSEMIWRLWRSLQNLWTSRTPPMWSAIDIPRRTMRLTWGSEIGVSLRKFLKMSSMASSSRSSPKMRQLSEDFMVAQFFELRTAPSSWKANISILLL